MSRTVVQVGPADHGKRMSLEDFDHAEGLEGHLYELSKGVITVMDVPDHKHFALMNAARKQLVVYDFNHPGFIYAIGGGSDSKILLSTEQSERHPDLSVYLSAPDPDEEGKFWTDWVPDIAVEIVSRSSRHRDYVEKREEYLKFGVREYWILDGEKEEMLALRRSGGRWIEQVIGADQVYGTQVLPGLDFSMKPIFDAARAAK